MLRHFPTNSVKTRQKIRRGKYMCVTLLQILPIRYNKILYNRCSNFKLNIFLTTSQIVKMRGRLKYKNSRVVFQYFLIFSYTLPFFPSSFIPFHFFSLSLFFFDKKIIEEFRKNRFLPRINYHVIILQYVVPYIYYTYSHTYYF